MGQKTSALKKTRAAVKDTQSPNASVTFPEHDAQCQSRPPGPPRSERIITLPCRKAYAQRIGQAISKAFRTSREFSIKPVRKTLLDLPTEIILGVSAYLPPSSLVSFDLFMLETPPSALHLPSTSNWKTQRKAQLSDFMPAIPFLNLESICNKQNTHFSEAMSKSRTQLYLSERLKLLCMLDRDGRVPSSEAICSGCADTHDCSLFSVSSLAQPSAKRRCLGSAGFLWICPHQILDYGQAQTLREVDESHRCGSNPVHVLPGYTTSWPIIRVTRNGTPSNEEVREALRPLNAPICPHLRLNDAYVASIYSQDCQKLRSIWNRPDPTPTCRCLTCASKSPLTLLPRGECKFCGTDIQFCIKPESYGAETLQLVIMRDIMRKIRGIQSCTDRAWINHVADPAGFEEYERAWQATNAECWRKVGSVMPPF